MLNGTINPNGHATQYDFIYGATTAYGATSLVRTVPAGTKAVAGRAITGLTPGTTYHYRISVSPAEPGGADRATHTGHPPAAVVTGGAVSVGKTVATPPAPSTPRATTT